MAEMLVRMVDKRNLTDARSDAQLTKRGDVITIQDDKFAWSKNEAAGNPWVIVSVPGAKLEDLSAFIAPEPFDPAVDQKLPQRKAFKFDIDLWQLSGSRSLSLIEALALKVTKPVILDSSVIGK